MQNCVLTSDAPLHGRSAMQGAAFEYVPRNPEASVLYGVVAEQLETFLARQQARDRPVPKFVEDEFRAFLDCGVLAQGFIRVHCDVFGHDRLVPFSYRRRGWCPSCGGRRMAETAAHLVDHVFPMVPVRQWVLSIPFGPSSPSRPRAPSQSVAMRLSLRRWNGH